jgi:hypothetical protein
MKKEVLSILIFGALVPGVASADFYVAPQCPDCQLGTPPPDMNTIQALDDYGVPSAFNHAPVTFKPGDTVQICNRVQCVTYVRTSDNKYSGGPATPISGSPPSQCH